MHAPLNEIPTELDLGDIQTRGVVWGDQCVRHIALPAGTDLAPLLAGLPGDVCHSAHYGFVVEGTITVTYDDGTEETTSAGEAYYWRGGHVGRTDTGVVFWEFSPEADIRPVLDHLGAQLAAAPTA